MRVTNNYNTYTHHQPKSKSKSTGFGKMLSEMSANKSQESEKQANLDKWSFNMQKVNPHQDHGTQIKPDKEWLNSVGQPNTESKGDKDLTGPQILFLQTNYDIENLTPEARHSLLCDLTDMDVLSVSDINSDDQSKVDDVLEKIKTFKMGVLTYVEFPEQPELLISDGSDPELRGLSDDEKFAAIVKKYEGGTTIDSFSQITSALCRNKLITWEQRDLLSDLAWGDYFEKRRPIENAPGFSMQQGKLFHMNYRVTMDNLLKEATRFRNYSKSIGQPCKIDESFLKEFASKFEALSKTK